MLERRLAGYSCGGSAGLEEVFLGTELPFLIPFPGTRHSRGL